MVRSLARRLFLVVVAALCLRALPAVAQEDGEPLPESEHPASDSPEAVTAAQVRSGVGKRRAQAFLIPLDEKARAATGRVAVAIERVLAGSKQYDVVDLAKALASDAGPAQEAKAAEGRRLRAEGSRAFEAHGGYIEAVPKLKAAVKAMSSGLAGLEAGELADTVLRLASAQQLAGDLKAARESYLAAALLDPQQKLVARSADPIAEGQLKLARADLDAVPIGSLEVETRPTGSRVLIDGQPHGTSPVRLELTGGKHVVRLERTGFYPTAELVEVTSRRETVYSITLQATPGASQVNQLIAGAADEANRGMAGERCGRLAERFRLERVLIGSVATHQHKVAVMLALANPSTGALISKDDLLLTADGTDADQVEADVQTSARKLLAADEDSGAAGATAAAPSASATAGPARAAPAPQGYGGMPGGQAAPAPAAEGRRAVMPGAAPAAPEPTSDEPGLVVKERRVAMPGPSPAPSPAAQPGDAPATTGSAAAPSAAAAAQAGDAPRPERPAGEPKRESKSAKEKGIKGKSGTEKWGDDD
jgi:PEGA domain